MSGVPAVLRPDRDFAQGELLRARGFFVKADAAYARVLRPSLRRMDPVLWVEACLSSAACRRSLGDVRGAGERLRQARSARRAFRGDVYRDRIALEEALVERAAGRYTRALSSLSERLARTRDSSETAFILWAMGGALRFQGRLVGSEAAFRRSLSIARRLGDKAAVGYALFGLGGVTRIRGRLAGSAGHYAAAARAFRGTEDLFGRAYAECGLANALRQLGRLKQARERYRRSLGLYSRIGDEPDLAYVEWGLGKCELGAGEPRAALPWLSRALRRFSCHHEARGEVLAGIALAQALHAVGRTAEGERLFERACRLSRKSGLRAHLEVYT